MPATGTAAGRASSTARPAAATSTPPAGGSSRRGTSAYAPDSPAARAGLAEPPAAPAPASPAPAAPASSSSAKKPATSSKKPAASTSSAPAEKPAQDPLTAPASSSSLPTMPTMPAVSIPGNGAGFLLGLVGYALLVNFMRGGMPQVKGWIGAKFLNKPYQGSTVEATAGGQSARAQRITKQGGGVDPLVKSHLAALSHATAGKP
jgi:hypothetical protein